MTGGNDKKIGVASLSILFFNLALAKYLLVLPYFMVGATGSAAWIAILLKGLASLALFLAVSALYRPYVELGMGRLSREALGRPIGSVMNVAVVGVMLVRGGFLFRILAEALQTLEAENATVEYVAVFVLIPVLVCSLRGFGANVNASILILPFTALSVAVISLALLPHYDTANLMPILGLGEKAIIEHSFFRLSGTFEILYLLTLSRSVKDYKTFRLGGLIGIGAITAVSTVLALIYCLAVPYPASKNFFFPLYQLTRMIKAGSFLQRMEPTVIFVWTGVIICGLTTLVVSAAQLLRVTAGENDGRGFVPMLVMLLFFVGALPASELDTYDVYRVTLNWSHYFYIGFVFLLLLTARLRKIERRLPR